MSLNAADRREVGVVVVRGGVGDPPRLQRVVGQDQAAGAHARQKLLVVVHVVGLVGVDEGDIDRLRRGQGAQRLECRSEAQLDAVSDAGALHARLAIAVYSSLTSQHNNLPPGCNPRAMQIDE